VVPRAVIGTVGDSARTVLISLITQRSQVRIRWIIARTLRPPTVDSLSRNESMINVARFVARNTVD
jgi:hypothetical protein